MEEPVLTPNANAPAYGRALCFLAKLFFMWGFTTVINNTLLPQLRSVFDLNYTKTSLIESTWFIAYFVASMPSAWLIERIGYKNAVVPGLIIMAIGALGMVPAARLPSHGITLGSLFAIASGITLLPVVANPYVTVIGPSESASARLNIVQATTSLGTTLAPLFGGYLILGSRHTLEDQRQIRRRLRAAEKRAPSWPVLLWIHGRGNSGGSGPAAIYDGAIWLDMTRAGAARRNNLASEFFNVHG